MKNVTATVADADLAWLITTVKQYDWYIAGERALPKPNPRALAVLTAARDRYQRLAYRLTPSVIVEGESIFPAVVSRIATTDGAK